MAESGSLTEDDQLSLLSMHIDSYLFEAIASNTTSLLVLEKLASLTEDVNSCNVEHITRGVIGNCRLRSLPGSDELVSKIVLNLVARAEHLEEYFH